MLDQGLAGLGRLQDEAEPGGSIRRRVEGVGDALVDPIDGERAIDLGPKGLVDRIRGCLEISKNKGFDQFPSNRLIMLACLEWCVFADKSRSQTISHK